MTDLRSFDPTEFVSVVIPVYAEGNHLRSVLEMTRTALVRAYVSYEIIVVDDGSPDNTWDVISEEAKSSSRLRGIRLSRNFGKESAVCAGLELARGDAVIVMDGDGQHPPSLVTEMIRVWREEGVDIVEAMKVTRGEETFFGKLTAGLFYLLWNKLSGYELKGASDFKLLTRRTVDAWLQMEERNLFFRGMTAWLGFTRVQIPFNVELRAGGKSGWSFLRRLGLALTGISAFSSLPLQFVTFAGVFFLAFSILFGIYTLVLQFAGRSVTGFATVILLLLIIGSLLMISLGIIGEYLARIYEEVKRRPRYVIARSIEAPVTQHTNLKALSATAKG
jgi:glycosyltransferase involved in cell wall biosynthesis